MSKFICIGGCSASVDRVEDIPATCRCGLIGRFSYYPREYILDFAEKQYSQGLVPSVSDGYILVIKELRKKYFSMSK